MDSITKRVLALGLNCPSQQNRIASLLVKTPTQKQNTKRRCQLRLIFIAKRRQLCRHSQNCNQLLLHWNTPTRNCRWKRNQKCLVYILVLVEHGIVDERQIASSLWKTPSKTPCLRLGLGWTRNCRWNVELPHLSGKRHQKRLVYVLVLVERGIVDVTSNRLISLENAIKNASSTSWSWLNAKLSMRTPLKTPRLHCGLGWTRNCQFTAHLSSRLH